MCKVDGDRIQSFHMQALRHILGIGWYDRYLMQKSMRERNYQTQAYC